MLKENRCGRMRLSDAITVSGEWQEAAHSKCFSTEAASVAREAAQPGSGRAVAQQKKPGERQKADHRAQAPSLRSPMPQQAYPFFARAFFQYSSLLSAFT